MTKKEKQKNIADLIQQFKDNDDKELIVEIGDKIIQEVDSIPIAPNFHFLVTITKSQLKKEIEKFAQAREEGNRIDIEEAKTALGYTLTLQVIPLIGESDLPNS